jgi:hypothetical protein
MNPRADGERIVGPILDAKTITTIVTTRRRNAVTATMNRYRLSTRGASVDACSGKSGIPENIN